MYGEQGESLKYCQKEKARYLRPPSKLSGEGGKQNKIDGEVSHQNFMYSIEIKSCGGDEKSLCCLIP